MKKKTLSLLVTMIAAVIMVTPLIGTVQARRTKEPYSTAYGVSPIPGTMTVDKTVGVVRIRRGTVLQGPYDGPLGIGTMTAELLIRMDNSKSLKTVITFKNTLEITSGPFGAFTLEGSTHFMFDEEGYISGKTKLQGMSEVGPVTIIADKRMGPPLGIVEEGIIIHP